MLIDDSELNAMVVGAVKRGARSPSLTDIYAPAGDVPSMPAVVMS